MEDFNPEVKLKKKGASKLIAIIVAAVVLLLGGSVAAFVLLDSNTDKANYFMYEKNTAEFFKEQVEERFANELEWSEQAKEKATENNIELTAEVNVPLSDDGGFISPEQIINNSSINISTQFDPKEKVASAKLKGGFGNFTIEDFGFYLTADKIMFGLPFINEVLQLKGEDFGKLMHEMDPMSYAGDEKLDLNMIFEGNIISEEDAKYLEDEYVKFIYDALPEEAFEKTDETVKIENENVKTEKITFQLTEEQIKDILKETFTKMSSDDKLKKIIADYLQAQGTGPIVLGENASLDIPDFEKEFDNVMVEAIKGLDELIVPDGFASTIWVADKVIVKRDFSIEMGTTQEDLVKFYLTGYLLQDKTNVSFEYELGFADQFTDGAIVLDGTLANDKGNNEDEITLSFDGGQIKYESTEIVDGSKKDFKRTFSVIEESLMQVDLTWTGNAEYDGDQMSSTHQFTAAADGLEDDAVVLHVKRDGKVIDKVELPQEDNIKDIGSMSLDELNNYFENEVVPNFEQWLMSIIGFGF